VDTKRDAGHGLPKRERVHWRWNQDKWGMILKHRVGVAHDKRLYLMGTYRCSLQCPSEGNRAVKLPIVTTPRLEEH
jgi:hypothetical protein